MSLSTEQIARTEATRFDYQLKFYIGGHRDAVPEASIRSWQDYDFDVSSTLASDIDYDDTELSLADGSSFLSASSSAPRTLFIEPYDTSKAWERVTYTSKSGDTFSGLTRRTHTWPHTAYNHPAGSKVHQWVDVTDLIVPNFDLRWMRQGQAIKWQVTLMCLKYNRELFDRGNMLACKVRFDIFDGNGWSDWMVWWAGYIVDVPEAAHDFTDGNSFRINVMGVSQFIDRYEIPAHHIGRTNLALGQPTATSSYLQDPTLEQSGEYFKSATVDGSNAVDGDIATPWVSQGAPTTTESSGSFSTTKNGFHQPVWITEVYFQPSGYGDDYIWVELYNPHDTIENGGAGPQNISGYYLANKQTTYGSQNPHNPGVLPPDPTDNFITIPDVDIPPKGFLILCKKLDSFEQWWMVIGENDAYDWRKVKNVNDPPNVDGTGSSENMTFDRTGDFLQLRRGGGWDLIQDEVFWGNITPADYYHDEDTAWWSGDPINYPDAIPAGKSIRRTTAGGTNGNATEWTIEDYPSPGTHRTLPSGEYISVDIGTIPTTLAQELSPGMTQVEVDNGTLGFPKSGKIAIGTEQIDYTDRDGSNFYGLGSFTGTYAEGTAVYPVVDGVANQYFPVVAVGHERPVGRPAPKIFRYLASQEASPRYPGDDDWEDDWDVIIKRVTVETDEPLASFMSNKFDSPLYYRHYMLQVFEMSDGGRVKVGELKVLVKDTDHTDSDDTDHEYDGEHISDIIKHLFVDHFGLDSSKLAVPSGGDTVVLEQDIQKAPLGQVAESLAEMTNAVIEYQLSNGVRWKIDPLMPYGYEPEALYTFDETTIESPLVLTLGGKNQVSQVELYAIDKRNNTTYHVYWPSSPNRYGRKVVIRGILLGNQTLAVHHARNLYRRANLSSEIVLRPKGICEWVTPTARIAVKWSQDKSDNPFFQYREYIVNSIVWSVRSVDNRKSWVCELHCEGYVGL